MGLSCTPLPARPAQEFRGIPMSAAADTPKPGQPAKPVRRSRKAAASGKAAAAGAHKAAAAPATRGTGSRRQPERRNLATRPAQLMNSEQILQTLHNEHRYMGRIFEAFKEQL